MPDIAPVAMPMLRSVTRQKRRIVSGLVVAS